MNNKRAKFQEEEEQHLVPVGTLDVIPLDILRDVIFPFCVSKGDSLKNATSIMLTCKTWNILLRRSNGLWKRVYFDVLNPKSVFSKRAMNIRSWFYMCQRRADVLKNRSIYSSAPIEGCDVLFECPLKFEELKNEHLETKIGDAMIAPTPARFCNQCNKNVYMVPASAAAAFADYGVCIAVQGKERIRPMLMGMIARVN